ncbi:hypothetical protein ACE02D_18930 [Shewanella bicestrii]|uniref:hypothetical protein n=1 Tax=unclassified Shewanella TaxID=196818 RepID=UPI000B346B48|nr:MULTISPECIES: hypothetical protein [unclassified Shewanella]MDH0448983.1 hypothetical protein [Shewanella sp. GD04112]MDH1470679.1 hypothetical protein [Shewanella sp. GD03713]QXN26652.1 hypothetical protein KVP08_008875 [Shewanella putrefaciens]
MAEINAISEEIHKELEHLAEKGLALLSLTETTPPQEIVAAITELTRDYRANQRMMDDDVLYALGTLLGWQYVRGLNWHWGSVVWDFDEANGAIGVLNQDNSLFNNPIGWMDNIMASEGGVPFMLSYNMIAAGQAPVFEANSASGLY